MKGQPSHSLADVSNKEPSREATIFVIVFYEAEGERKHKANAPKRCTQNSSCAEKIHDMMKASDYAAGGW